MYSRVGVEAGLDSLEETRAATAAVLHALRDRLTPREAEQPAAQLPQELKELWRGAVGGSVATPDQSVVDELDEAQVARWAPLDADARATSARAALSEALDRFERLVRRAARIARDGRR